MTTTADLRPLADRVELAALVSRLGRWLDDPDSASPNDLLADEVSVRTPGGEVEGRERVIAQARRNHDGHVTQHLMTDVLVDLGGGLDGDGVGRADEARISANLLVSFVDPAAGPAPTWQSGSRYRFSARRLPGGHGRDGTDISDHGWRLTRIEVAPVWQKGKRPTPVAA